ncbi:hypothetical protein Scep_029071 [Stephania cephalantha]|uniref:Uncharacterized protein n=1 Tax=Stephania cephalantha TaxID=152367 RepID=A0AAP0DWW5_9MAGN
MSSYSDVSSALSEVLLCMQQPPILLHLRVHVLISLCITRRIFEVAQGIHWLSFSLARTRLVCPTCSAILPVLLSPALLTHGGYANAEPTIMGLGNNYKDLVRQMMFDAPSMDDDATASYPTSAFSGKPVVIKTMVSTELPNNGFFLPNPFYHFTVGGGGGGGGAAGRRRRSDSEHGPRPIQAGDGALLELGSAERGGLLPESDPRVQRKVKGMGRLSRSLSQEATQKELPWWEIWGLRTIQLARISHLQKNNPDLILLVGDVTTRKPVPPNKRDRADLLFLLISVDSYPRDISASWGFPGKVHAYERSNRVYNYSLDPCGPVYITVGDGGNRENGNQPCADEPGQCPDPLSTPDEIMEVSVHTTSLLGPANGQFCWDRQPDYSAYRGK